MKYFPLYFISLILTISANVKAQDKSYCLHPAVGDTIDMAERIKYNILPESTFPEEIALVYQQNDSIYQFICLQNDSIINVVNTTKGNIDEYRTNISKLQHYYDSQSEIDSSKIHLANSPTNISSVNLHLFNSQTKKDIKNEIKLDRQRKYANQREKNQKMGHLF
ncbi:MAG: hypothetical protein N4A71_14740 [Carboxylicivirga sp.]|jgi:hypothetical protein|nr:hypothetical protein [Carboxylicivirga sp.]